MRLWSLIVLSLLVVPVPVRAQTAAPEPVEPERDRKWSLSAGLGSTAAGLGVLGELYLHDRVSLLAAFGRQNTGDGPMYKRGPAAAAGVRGYVISGKHRVFVEVGVAPLANEYLARVATGEVVETRWLYGPTLQAGYHLVADSGLTFSISIGGGRTADATAPLTNESYSVGTLSLGYTFHH